MRLHLVAPILSLALLAGCANQDKHHETQKEAAKKQWASARANVLGNMAIEQYEGGNFDKCRQTVDEALKMDPENVALRILSAKVHIEKGNLEGADRELIQARRLAPTSGEADYLSGVVCQRWQKTQEACDFYRSASEKQPNELAYLMAHAELLVALNRSDEALSLLQSKVVYFEYSAAIRDAVGQLLMQKGKYAQAVDAFRQASTLASDDSVIREHLAMAQFQAKSYRDAADNFARLLKDDKYLKRSDIYMALAESQMQSNRPREARENFEMATQLAPNNAAAWLALGKAAMQLNDLRRAEIALKRSATIDPASSECHLLMGYARLKQGNTEEALASFRKSSALDGNDTVSLCMVGYALEKLGRSEEALKAYARALKMKPGDELATRLMAEVQLDR